MARRPTRGPPARRVGPVSEPSVPAQGPHLDPAAPGETKTAQPHLFVQAPVPALDVDGMTAVVLGVVVFALASVLLGLFHDPLVAAGNGWWLGVTLSGLALGLIGLVHTGRRHRHRRSDPSAP